MSDDKDSPLRPATATVGEVRVFVPEGRTAADVNRDDKNSNGDQQVITGQKEIGGRDGPDPTRFGDWEIKGRCIDF
ncbi:MAG TPA: DUF1674 domain-containing protein [Woeseiaceae bacterium]